MTPDKYKQAFQEEARELLVELESSLLELDQNRTDTELIGRAFRALHTIKGSGAMFGFEDISGFAHGLEAAFDLVRNGQAAATGDLINLGLAAGDQIRTMLDQAEGRDRVDPSRIEEIRAELRQFAEGVAPDPCASPRQVDPVAGEVGEWRIRFRPGLNILLNGVNPLLILRELRGLGELRVSVDTSGVPTLADIDPEQCYLAWDLTLISAASNDSIRDVFIFVEDACDITIECAKRVAGSEPAAASANGCGQVSKARSADGSGSLSSIRVATDKLDQLVNLVGELVTVQARLSRAAGQRGDPGLCEISEAIDRLTSSLRENSMSIRMLPLKATFERFRRLVHDLGADLHKSVDLVIEGAETELDKTVIDRLNDPLIHLIRNSMDHGIEAPDQRAVASKPAAGTIRLSAQHSGANVLIKVSDDGRGLNVDAVRARAIERGLIDSSARLTDAEMFSFILAPGFSTAREVTEVSGRGVGMDVVRRSIEGLRGSIDIDSRPGQGMTITLRLPLTLSIIDGVLVQVANAYFVVPEANSLECIGLTREEIQEAHGRRVANVRGELIPYIRLSEYFQMPVSPPEREQIMIVDTEHGNYGFVVDQVLGSQQTVIKDLGKLYRHVQAFSGATILGDGTVALILDPHRLAQGALQAEAEMLGNGSRSGNRG